MQDSDGLAAEQAVVDALYSRLDALRDEASSRLAAIRREGPSGSPQNRSERDAFATLYEDRIAQLDAVEDRLCFGRLDLADGERLYVGRTGLSTPDHTPLLTDWRAPAARPFYSATAVDPNGVMIRRHITTRSRTVTAIEDDVLDIEALRTSGGDASLAGEGALIAALSEHRTGHMTDIVATIQAEQDAVIRGPLEGALVVQGGPGTGKTAVALHRAAYLLYHHRARLESSGILLIGPSPLFLRYIEHVLPSLGETGVVSTTLGGLVRGVETSARADDAVAALKGNLAMADVVKRAVRERQRLPLADRQVVVDGHPVTIRREDLSTAQSRARRDGSPHNTARAVFVKEMLEFLTTQLAEGLGDAYDPDNRGSLTRELRDHREVRVALNLAWMPLTPERLLRDLFSRPHLLDHATPGMTPDERALLARPAEAPFTDADIPLLDEAAELVGDPAGASVDPGSVTGEDVEYARQVLEAFGGSGVVSAEALAGRWTAGRTRSTVAERASQDRTWAYGHVVVDEAQEISPMAWRMLVRRCPTRSFTIVGDLAQASSNAGTHGWHETLDPIFGEHWTERLLTVSYRIPASVAILAQRFAEAAGLPVGELSAVRDLEGGVRRTSTPEPLQRGAAAARRHAADLVASGGGVVALIVPDALLAAARAEAESPGVSVLTPRDAKGLEFDIVVIVEPSAIALHPGDLYVALTRATRLVDLVHREPLPAGLED